LLSGHQVETAYELGWAELTNGDLLRMAEDAGFEALITTDQSIRYQQNLRGRRLALAVLSTNDWTQIRNCKAVIVERISENHAGIVSRNRDSGLLTKSLDTGGE